MHKALPEAQTPPGDTQRKEAIICYIILDFSYNTDKNH